MACLIFFFASVQQTHPQMFKCELNQELASSLSRPNSSRDHEHCSLCTLGTTRLLPSSKKTMFRRQHLRLVSAILSSACLYVLRKGRVCRRKTIPSSICFLTCLLRLFHTNVSTSTQTCPPCFSFRTPPPPHPLAIPAICQRLSLVKSPCHSESQVNTRTGENDKDSELF